MCVAWCIPAGSRVCGWENIVNTANKTETVRVELPPRFYDDHVDRDLPSGIEVKRTKRGVTVDLDAEAFADLLGDADHYATGDFDPDLLGLVASARATLKRLRAITPPTKGADWVDPATGCTVRPVSSAGIAQLRKPGLPPLAYGDMVIAQDGNTGSFLCSRGNANPDSLWRQERAAFAFFAAHEQGALSE